jgi:hypothetical protein
MARAICCDGDDDIVASGSLGHCSSRQTKFGAAIFRWNPEARHGALACDLTALVKSKQRGLLSFPPPLATDDCSC